MWPTRTTCKDVDALVALCCIAESSLTPRSSASRWRRFRQRVPQRPSVPVHPRPSPLRRMLFFGGFFGAHSLALPCGRPPLHRSGSQNGNINFRFSSMRQWGEMAAGEWTLTVRDAATGQVGTLNTWEIRAIGDIAGNDNLYVYTDDFGIVPSAGFASLADTNGGVDTINTAPIKAPVIIDLASGPTGRTSINEQSLIISSSTVIENAISG